MHTHMVLSEHGVKAQSLATWNLCLRASWPRRHFPALSRSEIRSSLDASTLERRLKESLSTQVP